MVTDEQRNLVHRLMNCGAFDAKLDIFGLVRIEARWGFRWLLKRLKERQPVDNLHHAPACPANHYHRCRLVFQPCTCGAAHASAQGKEVGGK